MPTPLTLNAHATRHFDAPVREIQVASGTIVVTHGEKSNFTEEGKSYDLKGEAGATVYSPDSARITVVFADEPAPVLKPKVAKKSTKKAAKK